MKNRGLTVASGSGPSEGGDSPPGDRQRTRVPTKPRTARNVRGGSGDPNRGSWCTPLPIARAVGPWDLDPFSNPRSHVEARIRCMLEDGGDGFGDRSEPGAYRFGGSSMIGVARADMRVWIQPPYDDDFPMRALAHYGHTRFCALLRFDPRTTWWRAWYRRARLVVVPYRCNFEPPPGVTAPGSTFPHALYYRDPSDVTPAILRLGVAWRTGNP